MIMILISVLAGVILNCDGGELRDYRIQTDRDLTGEISSWITKADGSELLNRQTGTIPFTTSENKLPVITVDTSSIFQTMDGFGYTLTGGSALLINKLKASEKRSLLIELFGKEENSIDISYLRISIGASDLNPEVFSYNDLPDGETDIDLKKFTLSEDTTDLIPLLKEILKINPGIKIMGSPWSAPSWMKDNGGSKGGSLLPEYYGVYANYFVKYILAMRAEGIYIDAITPQNEPQHGGNNPSMVMSALQQADFIKNHLGPAFAKAGIRTKIVIWDHNCDRPDYPITVLNDPEAKRYIDGSAFHLYGGEITALSTVRDAHPDKNIYFTEQWTGAKGSFEGDLMWHVKNIIIGSANNWSRVALEWNLANDPKYDPHTPGGCTECRGALTIDGNRIERNVSYYIIAHASKFVTPGSVRIASKGEIPLANVAFRRPDGKKVLIALNESRESITFNLKSGGKSAMVTLGARSVATYVW